MGSSADCGVALSMSESETPKRLTINDPVDPAVLTQLEGLDRARLELSGQLLDLEQQIVGILAAAHRIDQQRQRVFDNILIERGIDTKTLVQVDSKTGGITVRKDVE